MQTRAPGLFFAGLLLAGAGLAPIDEQRYKAVIAENRGHVLLVSFWATWCEPCRAELPQLAAMEQQLPRKNFRLAVISIDEPEQAAEARQLCTGAKLRGPVYIGSFQDRDRFINYIDRSWSGALPALFLYDRSGHLVRSFTGEVSLPEVREAVRAAFAAPLRSARSGL